MSLSKINRQHIIPIRWTKEDDLPKEERYTAQEQHEPVPPNKSQSFGKLNIASCQELNFKDYIGDKSQNLEFTACYLTMDFIQDVAKYACALMNSDGGTLLIGVSDEGLVCGTPVNHKMEDEIRLKMDKVGQSFNPTLFPHNYTMRFLPVLNATRPNLKVVCLTFKALPAWYEVALYWTKSMELFIRWNGSIQGPLSDSCIEKYERQRAACRSSKKDSWFSAGQKQEQQQPHKETPYRIRWIKEKDLPLEEPHTSQQRDKPVDIASCQELNFQDYMGHETRNLEFKIGQGGYLTYHFRDHAVKYGCAFLNTEGGTLLIGVSDDGLVHGTYVDDQQEKNIRQLMGQVAREFNPPLCRDDYTLRFLPVLKDEEPDLKVVCLTFRAPPALSEPTLYRTAENMVFIRWDASVQGPLSDSDSEEYQRQRVILRSSETDFWSSAGQKHEQPQALGSRGRVHSRGRVDNWERKRTPYCKNKKRGYRKK